MSLNQSKITVKWHTLIQHDPHFFSTHLSDQIELKQPVPVIHRTQSNTNAWNSTSQHASTLRSFPQCALPLTTVSSSCTECHPLSLYNLSHDYLFPRPSFVLIFSHAPISCLFYQPNPNATTSWMTFSFQLPFNFSPASNALATETTSSLHYFLEEDCHGWHMVVLP